jgi:hypothetical protein
MTLDYLFELRWRRLKWFWATVVFEWLFLSGLAYVALRPWIRGLGPWGWALHLGVLPLLFLLPAYLGYATFSFTSAGPSGGVLYPWLLMELRGSCTTLDRWVLAHLPQVLEPLSPTIGTPMVLSGRGMPGPTYALIAGLVVGGSVLALNRLCRESSPAPLRRDREPTA